MKEKTRKLMIKIMAIALAGLMAAGTIVSAIIIIAG